MAKKFSELRSRMSAESRARAEIEAQTMLAEMPLNELRQARGLSQKALAEVLHVQQPSIAKLEKRADMYLSTLRSHIQAMGGELDVIRSGAGTVGGQNSSAWIAVMTSRAILSASTNDASSHSSATATMAPSLSRGI